MRRTFTYRDRTVVKKATNPEESKAEEVKAEEVLLEKVEESEQQDIGNDTLSNE